MERSFTSPRRLKFSRLRSRFKADTQKGYILLAVMLLITVMLIGLALEAPRIVQQIKREKEEELIHRGKEYATAIRKYYRKTGTYPVSLEQLENTNTLRFLRQRYKDPMTVSGEWKLVHVGEAQITIPTAPAGGVPGLNGSNPLGGSSTPTPSPTPGGFGANPGMSGGMGTGGVGAGGVSPGGVGTGGVSPGGFGNQPAAGGPAGAQPFGSPLSGSSQGVGPIIGVASTSKSTSIKEFNGSNEYDQWMFVYDPRLEPVPGSNGIIIASPRSASSPTTGTPAGAVPAAPGTQPVPGNPAPTPMGTPTPQAVPQ
jgi:type II secretory pathway pseudopilin PulG